MSQACYFLGASLHTALGRDTAENITALTGGPTLPTPIKLEYAQHQLTLPYKTLAHCPLTLTARLETVLGNVIDAALTQAEITAQQRTNLGLFLGSTSFDMCTSETHYRTALTHTATAIALEHSSSIGNLALNIRQRFGLRGPDFSFNTACTASANALMYADTMIRNGQLDYALVVGIEILTVFTALGFQGLQLLSPTTMKPFASNRDGLVLGEACAALVLGPSAPHKNSFYLRGAANLCDTHSLSTAHPSGSSIARVMQHALFDAQLAPDDITALKSHGTASQLNDTAEAAGVRQIFLALPPITALKPHLGHTLGACGLNELLLFCAAAERGFLIGTHHSDIAKPSGEFGLPLNQRAQDLPPGHFMLNYFGFGGNNTSLIVSNKI